MGNSWLNHTIGIAAKQTYPTRLAS